MQISCKMHAAPSDTPQVHLRCPSNTPHIVFHSVRLRVPPTMDSLRGSSVKLGTVHEKISMAPAEGDDTNKSRRVPPTKKASASCIGSLPFGGFVGPYTLPPTETSSFRRWPLGTLHLLAHRWRRGEKQERKRPHLARKGAKPSRDAFSGDSL